MLVKEDSYPLFVTMHFIPAALAAASPIALSSTTTQLQNQGKKKDMNEYIHRLKTVPMYNQ